jgi:hypothetical protein
MKIIAYEVSSGAKGLNKIKIRKKLNQFSVNLNEVKVKLSL